MKKNYINPTFKVYGFEPESEFLGTSPTAGQIVDDGDNTVVKPGGDYSGDLDAAGYRSNLWN